MARTIESDVAALTDPLLQFNFDLFIANVPGATGFNAREFKTKIRTAAIPGMQIEPVEIGLHGYTYDVAGKKTFTRTMPFELLELRNMASRRVLREWSDFTRDKSSVGNFYTDYTTSVDMIIYDDKGATAETTRLYKCWLESFDDVSMDGNTSGEVAVSGTLRYAYWETV